MHLEFLVEDSSGHALLEHLLPKIIGRRGEPHTYRLISYRGIGHIPKDLKSKSDPSKRVLLSRLPSLLRGLCKIATVDAIVVVLDADKRDVTKFRKELNELAKKAGAPDTVFGLAVEELEAWYLGDRKALLSAYPRAQAKHLRHYDQDSQCGTWELLADAVFEGGAAACKAPGGKHAGDLKHEWARRIGRLLDVEINLSPSFQQLRDALRILAPMSG